MPWSGHPRGYKVAKWSLGSVQSVCCFEVAGLGVRLGVVVSGAESSLVARRVWTFYACLR